MAGPSSARYLRSVNYLAGAQIYLHDNVLLREPLRPEHVKDRLLGHWGTCPGINLVYAGLNRLIPRLEPRPVRARSVQLRDCRARDGGPRTGRDGCGPFILCR